MKHWVLTRSQLIFQSADSITGEQAAERIGRALLDKYEFEVPVIVRKMMEMENTLMNNPFPQDRNLDPERMHVTFLAEPPQKEYLYNIRKYDYPPDRFEIIGQDVFLYCPNGYGKSRLNNSFFENKLKVLATTRNWRTVKTLTEMANEI
jgi:uncharacterized protein (DUF1697 family)